MLTFSCPQCSQKYVVAADKAGRRSKCKKCGTGVTVPYLELDWLEEGDKTTPSTEPPRLSNPGVVAWAVGGGACAVLFVGYLLMRGDGSPAHESSSAPSPTPARPWVPAGLMAKTAEERARAAVTDWLDDLKKGEPGNVWWMDVGHNNYGSRVRPRSVRSYQILSATPHTPLEQDTKLGYRERYVVRVRVDCSDERGQHITRDWALTVLGEGHVSKLVGAV